MNAPIPLWLAAHLHEVGTEPGDTCGRYAEPEEGATRYYPRPCGGEMMDDGGYVVCDRCGEMG
jgi:hypothetical protein